jgi:hypothetical protein
MLAVRLPHEHAVQNHARWCLLVLGLAREFLIQVKGNAKGVTDFVLYFEGETEPLVFPYPYEEGELSRLIAQYFYGE